MSHSLLRSLHHLPGAASGLLSLIQTLRGSGEINDQTHLEKRERTAGVHHRQVQPRAEGARGTAAPCKRESPDERTELTGGAQAKAGPLWEAGGRSPLKVNEFSV